MFSGEGHGVHKVHPFTVVWSITSTDVEVWRVIFRCVVYGYGSIPINTIFNGMNIHLPAILMFTRGARFWHTAIFRTFWGSLRQFLCVFLFALFRLGLIWVYHMVCLCSFHKERFLDVFYQWTPTIPWRLLPILAIFGRDTVFFIHWKGSFQILLGMEAPFFLWMDQKKNPHVVWKWEAPTCEQLS